MRASVTFQWIPSCPPPQDRSAQRLRSQRQPFAGCSLRAGWSQAAQERAEAAENESEVGTGVVTDSGPAAGDIKALCAGDEV